MYGEDTGIEWFGRWLPGKRSAYSPRPEDHHLGDALLCHLPIFFTVCLCLRIGPELHGYGNKPTPSSTLNFKRPKPLQETRILDGVDEGSSVKFQFSKTEIWVVGLELGLRFAKGERQGNRP
jgi:hypothetical protein